MLDAVFEYKSKIFTKLNYLVIKFLFQTGLDEFFLLNLLIHNYE